MTPDEWVAYFDPDDEPLSNMLPRLREEHGYKTQRDLARAIALPDENVSSLASLINKYESGGTKPGDDMAERLAEALGVSARRIRNASAAPKRPIPYDMLAVGPISTNPRLRLVVEEAVARYRASEEGHVDTDDADRAAHYAEAAEDQPDTKPSTKEAAG